MTIETAAPFPHINIGVYASSQDVKSAIEDAQGHRLMARVNVRKQTGGIAEAITFARDSYIPDLYLIEVDKVDERLVSQITELGALGTLTTNAILLGRSNDIRIYRQMQELSIAEYLVPPYAGTDIIKAIAKVYSRRSGQNGHVLSVIGAVGGAGTSTALLNFANSVTRSGSNAMIIDMNLGFGTIALDLDHQTAFDPTATYTGEPEKVDQQKIDRTLIPVNEQIRILPSPPSLSALGWSPLPETISRLIDESRGLAPLVLIDLPTFWSPWVTDAIRSSNSIMIVTTPTVQGLRNYKNLAEVLRTINHTPTVLINHCNIPKRPDVPLNEFEKISPDASIFTIDFDPVLFGRASSEGLMLYDIMPRSEPVQVFDAMVQSILYRNRTGMPAQSPAPAPTSGLIDRALNSLPFLRRS